MLQWTVIRRDDEYRVVGTNAKTGAVRMSSSIVELSMDGLIFVLTSDRGHQYRLIGDANPFLRLDMLREMLRKSGSGDWVVADIRELALAWSNTTTPSKN